MPHENTALMRIPLWIYPYTHDDTVVWDVLGQQGTFADAKHEKNLEAGCLLYGRMAQFRIDDTKIVVDDDTATDV